MVRREIYQELGGGLADKMSRLGVRESDISEAFIRSSGPGGQNVNKVSTCVYLKHVPTGIEVKCHKERTQALNRRLARQLLLEKIENRVLRGISEEKKELAKIRRQKRRKSKMAKLKILEAKRRHSEKKKMRRALRPEGAFLVLLLVCAALCFGLGRGYCTEDTAARNTKTLEGHITDVDWVARNVVVRWLQYQGEVEFDEITLFVPGNATITKGSDTISLADLEVTDEVSVKYYDASPGPLTAVSINVKI